MCDCSFNTALPGSGERVEQVISSHPRLTAEGIRAAMACDGGAEGRRCVPDGNDRRVNIVADENIDLQIVERLRADGHDVIK